MSKLLVTTLCIVTNFRNIFFRTMPLVATQDENGCLIKALPSGEPFPKDSKIVKFFRDGSAVTLPAALKLAVDNHPDKECMATRKLLSRHQEDVDGKPTEKLELGEYFWQTYSEIQESAEAVGCSLVKMNLNPGARIGIFGETRAEWFIAAIGSMQQRICVCTIYTTLSDDAIVHVLNETEVNVVFSSFDLLPRLSNLLNRTALVKTIIVMEDQLEGMGNTALVPANVSVIAMSQFSAKTNIDTRFLTTKPEPEDVAVVMYTSGSSGTPKGVELTHANIMAAVVSYCSQISLDCTDRYLAFLPLAHILELCSEAAMLLSGSTIFYSSPYTLTSSSPRIKSGTSGDAKIARPTVFASVPLLLDRIIKGVSQAVEAQGWLKCTVFNSLVSNKSSLSFYFPAVSNLLDRIVFQKIRDELGGNLKKIVVGGAPLSPQTHTNFQAMFGCVIQCGYGTTETTGCASGMNEDDNSLGNVGGPCLNVLLKLKNWEEGNYRTTDIPFPRGEIIIGGPSVAKGYFKLPRETIDAFVYEDGVHWFKTGDIGEIQHNGSIKIIDRKNDLVKLKHGEYISLGNAESIIKTHNVVDNICLFADSSKDKTVAIIVPVLVILQKIAASSGIHNANLTLEQLCEDRRVIAAVLKELQLHGKKGGLTRWEIPAAVHLTNELWTPDTGLVTAALKLRRKQIGQQYQSLVIGMYSRLED